MQKKIIGITLIIIILMSAFLLKDHLTLTNIKEQHELLINYIQNNFIISILVYFLFYIFVTALSVPGAAVVTLLGGALFGFWIGLILVSFASTIGATIAFLSSRYLLRDWVQDKFGSKLDTINQGVKDEGNFYLFSLRLIPIMPFFLINLLFGLTEIKTKQFYFVSQIGMLAGTAVYINAGTQLAKINSLSDIVSPLLLASFIALGLFPWFAKKILNVLKKQESNLCQK
jgi:uncharacterized membrane protein YdjX (TVP38/TMEM64 family)